MPAKFSRLLKTWHYSESHLKSSACFPFVDCHPPFFKTVQIAGSLSQLFETLKSVPKLLRALGNTSYFVQICQNIEKICQWIEKICQNIEGKKMVKRLNIFVSRLEIFVRKLKRFVKRLKVFVKSLKIFAKRLKRFVKGLSLTSTLMLTKC